MFNETAAEETTMIHRNNVTIISGGELAREGLVLSETMSSAGVKDVCDVFGFNRPVKDWHVFSELPHFNPLFHSYLSISFED